MCHDERAIFVFSRDPLPGVYSSLAIAAEELEAIDVRSGEYPALYTLDGCVIRANPYGERVELQVTSLRDMDGLRRRLREWADQGDLKSDPDDVVAAANELLRDAWEVRWPKRPRWLARRVHGDGPPQISSTR